MVNSGTKLRSRSVSHEELDFTTYSARVHMLVIFAVVNMSNAMLAFCFAPAVGSVSRYYKTTPQGVAALSSGFMGAYFPGAILAQFTTAMFGLRQTIVVGCSLTCCAVCLRALSVFGDRMYFLVFLGQLIGGFAQPFFFNAPSRLASNWFPYNERELATVIGAMTNPIGNALGQLFPTILIPVHASEAEINTGITSILLIQAVIVILAGAWVYVFFKSDPPTPPSHSAALRSREIVRTTFYDTMHGLRAKLRLLLCNRQFCYLLTGFGVGIAMFNSFLALINDITAPFGFSEDQSGIFGVVFILVGLVGAAICGVLLDTTHRYREILKGGMLFALLAILFLFLSLESESYTVVVLSFAFLGFCMLPLLPASIENAVECTFPIPEDDSTSLLLVVGNTVGVGMIVLMQYFLDMSSSLPSIISPFNIFVMSVGCFCLVMIILYKGEYHRMEYELQMNSLDYGQLDTNPLLNSFD